MGIPVYGENKNIKLLYEYDFSYNLIIDIYIYLWFNKGEATRTIERFF